MTTAEITANLANRTAETICDELRRHNLTEDDALLVLACICWSVMRQFRPEGDDDEPNRGSVH